MSPRPPGHYRADPALAAWVHALPKAETHLHLEGSTPPELLATALPGHPAAGPAAPPFWYPNFRYTSFDQFEALYVSQVMPYYTSAARYHEAARVLFARCVAQGCRYVETSFHLPGLAFAGLEGPAVLAALRAAVPPGLAVRLFGGLCHGDLPLHRELLEAALGWAELDGIDLHGPEYLPLAPGTADYWARARAAGKFTKAHAGEFMPAAFVAHVIDALGVTRVQHGVRAIEDPALVRRLARENIALDVCPISNVMLAVSGIPTMAAHPIRALFDAGVKVTVSTDDTYFFGNTLAEEYYALHHELAFTRAELARVARHGLEVALLPAAPKAALLAEHDAFVAATP
jgi:adenine deaminase